MNTLAKIKPNQLVQNPNFESSSNWVLPGTTSPYATLSIANNMATVSITGGTTGKWHAIRQYGISVVEGHRYLVMVDVNLSVTRTAQVLGLSSSGSDYTYNTYTTPNEWAKCWYLVPSMPTTQNARLELYIGATSGIVSGNTAQFKNAQVIDLTELYGEGNTKTYADYIADFPADFYEQRATTDRKLILSADGKAITL